MHVEKAFVICIHFFLAVYGARAGNQCIEDLKKSFTVQLQCPAGEWIHVVHEMYGNGDAATCHVKSADSCSKELVSSQPGLVVNCNGKQSCLEAMKLPPINSCNITDAAADVKYSCVNGSMNMCSPVITKVSGSVYLHSPGFPDSVGVNSSCVVRITGQTLQVTLVEQRMRSGILNISGDGRQLWTNEITDKFNMVLPGTAAEIVIVYKNHDQNGSCVWIRVADSGQMNITITSEILDASTTPTSTNQPPRSQSTSGPNTSNRTTTETTTSPQSTAIVIATNMTTKYSEASSTTTSSPEPGLIVWVVSAVSGCVLTILIVVIAVVLCRKQVKKSRPLETPSKGHFKLGSMNAEKHHSGFGQNETCHQCFMLDPEFVEGGRQSLKTEPGHRSETSLKNEQDQYAKALPLGSTVDMYDKSTFTVTNNEVANGAAHVIRDPNSRTGICGMTENDLYEGGLDDLRGGMIDNVVYDKFDFEREKESVQDDSDTSPNHSKQVWKNTCEMIENQVYDRRPPCAATDNHVGDLYDEGQKTNVGMVDNGLYDKFEYDEEKESMHDECDTWPSKSEQAWKDKCEMIENDVYVRGPPHLDEPFGSVADDDNPVDDLYDGGLETSGGMVDNELCDKREYDRETESPQNESDASPNNNKPSSGDKCEMIENNVYDGGPPHLDDPVGSMADNDNPVGDHVLWRAGN